MTVGTSRCDVPARVRAGGTARAGRPRQPIVAPLGRGADGAARRPCHDATPDRASRPFNGLSGITFLAAPGAGATCQRTVFGTADTALDRDCSTGLWIGARPRHGTRGSVPARPARHRARATPRAS